MSNGDNGGHNACKNENIHAWTELLKAASMVIAALAGLVAAGVGILNHRQIDEARQVQSQQVSQAEEVKETLDDVTAKTDAKLKRIEATTTETAKTVTDTEGLQLFNVWKNLEWAAYQSDLPADKTKAAEAKAAYEKYLREKNPGKGSPKKD